MHATQAQPRESTVAPHPTPDLHEEIQRILKRDFWTLRAGFASRSGFRSVFRVVTTTLFKSVLVAPWIGFVWLVLAQAFSAPIDKPNRENAVTAGALLALPFLVYYFASRHMFGGADGITVARVENKEGAYWRVTKQVRRNGKWEVVPAQINAPFEAAFDSPEGEVFVVYYRKKDSATFGFVPLTTEGRMNLGWLAPQKAVTGVIRPMAKELPALLEEFSRRCDAAVARAQKESVHNIARQVDQKKDAWKGIVLDQKIKDELFQSAMEFATGSPAASKGLLLYGPPGTGKTLIAKRLAETMGCAFIATTVAELKGPYIGQSAMHTKQVWTNALACQRAVLFVDECEGVFASRDSFETDSFVQEIVQTFLAQWDGFTKQRTVWVVGATNHRDKIDPAIRSRFGLEIEIPLPGGNERLQILSHELSAKGRRVTLPKEAKEFTQGFSGRDLENLAGRILRKMGTQTVLTPEMLAEVTAFKRTQGSTASDADATWDRLILPEKTLTQLKNTVTIFQKAEEFAKVGVSVPRGILLSGPAGTGKTQVARTMAKEGGLQFIAATTADLKAGYIGQSGQKVKELFARARACTPCILFLDELDIAAPERSRTNDSFSHEIVGQLLQELDGVQSIVGKIFLLGATNHPGSIDSAILSRFPSHIEIPLPDEEAREKILRAFLGKKPVAFDLGELRGVARRLAGKSGRDIRSIVERAEQTAVARAINDGGAEHFKLRVDDLV